MLFLITKCSFWFISQLGLQSYLALWIRLLWLKPRSVLLLFCLLRRVPLGLFPLVQKNHSTQRLLTKRDMLDINRGAVPDCVT